MKTTLMLALVSLFAVGAYAAEGAKVDHKAAMTAKKAARKECKDEGKKGKDFKACVKEKLEKK